MTGIALFTETSHCSLRLHCRTCRDLVGGRAWRMSLASAFVLPDGAPDFPCQHGFNWGDKPDIPSQVSAPPPAPKREPLAGVPENAAAVCMDCADRSCPNVHVCCGGRVEVAITVPCKDAKW